MKKICRVANADTDECVENDYKIGYWELGTYHYLII